MSILGAASRLVKVSGGVTLDATAMYRGSTKIWPVVDLDAQDYINRVQAADSTALGGTQTLEEGVKNAINAFVIGCKQDGIWGKIHTSAIFCGARSLQGALTRLTGQNHIPTIVSYGFVQGDYSRTLGIQGASSSAAGKYIDTRFNVSDTRFGQFPDASLHAAAYVGNTHDGVIMGSGTGPGIAEIGLRPFNTIGAFFRARDSKVTVVDNGPFSAGFVMVDRQNQLSTVYSQHSGQTFTATGAEVALKPYSTTIPNNTVWLFRRNQSGATPTAAQFNGRILYFSIGRSITGPMGTEGYYFGGSSRVDADGYRLNGVYQRSGPYTFRLQHADFPSSYLQLQEYDPDTNDQRYVLVAYLYLDTSANAAASQIAYVSMTKSPAGTQYPPSGPYQRVSGTVTDTESPYVLDDQQLLTVKYKARVDALIAGIQGAIV